jgi:hypothetical protein
LSLGIVIKGPEGLVLAAESRITLTAKNKETGKEVSVSYDNAQKVLSFSRPRSHVGAVTYGIGGIGQRSAYSYITEFESSVKTGSASVEDIAKLLSDFYLGQWNSVMPHDYKGPLMTFVVAGYNDGEAYGRVYLFEIPRAPKPEERNLGGFGITWGGQREIVDRLLTGYDARVLETAKNSLGLSDGQAEVMKKELSKYGMALPIQYLPLQDCVDLAIFFIRTTMEAQRLTVGIRGVGGPIDVATITRTGGLRWVQQKQLRGEVSTAFST